MRAAAIPPIRFACDNARYVDAGQRILGWNLSVAKVRRGAQHAPRREKIQQAGRSSGLEDGIGISIVVVVVVVLVVPEVLCRESLSSATKASHER